MEGVEATLSPGPIVMDGAGDELLARPGLPCDQDGALGGGDPFHQRVDFLHGWAVANQALEVVSLPELRLQIPVLLRKVPAVQGVLDAEVHDLGSRGLLQVVVGAQAAGFHRALQAAVGGEHDDDLIGPKLLELLQGLQAVHSGHPDVQQDDVEVLLLAYAQGFRSAGGDRHGVVLDFQADLEALEEVRLIVDDEDASFGHGLALIRQNLVTTKSTKGSKESACRLELVRSRATRCGVWEQDPDARRSRRRAKFGQVRKRPEPSGSRPV